MRDLGSHDIGPAEARAVPGGPPPPAEGGVPGGDA